MLPAGRTKRPRKVKLKVDQQHSGLATHLEHGYLALPCKRIVAEHVGIVGDSGSGKTWRVITPFLSQLIRNEDAPVVIVDLKNDMALFETVRIETERRRRT
jgi:hypothetical protein